MESNMSAKALSHADGSEIQIIERRRKERRQAEGEVVLFSSLPTSTEIRGCLLDVSYSGFRAVHQDKTLCPGGQFNFRHAFAQGSAQLIWNRIVGDQVESNFQILRKTRRRPN
jgi:hypothetical protein